jgi:hypothetical protein
MNFKEMLSIANTVLLAFILGLLFGVAHNQNYQTSYGVRVTGPVEVTGKRLYLAGGPSEGIEEPVKVEIEQTPYEPIQVQIQR